MKPVISQVYRRSYYSFCEALGVRHDNDRDLFSGLLEELYLSQGTSPSPFDTTFAFLIAIWSHLYVAIGSRLYTDLAEARDSMH